MSWCNLGACRDIEWCSKDWNKSMDCKFPGKYWHSTPPHNIHLYGVNDVYHLWQCSLLSYRWLVIKILSLINPGDVELRKRNRLIRRIYRSKVMYSLWHTNLPSPSSTSFHHIAYAYCHIQGPNYCWHVDSYDKFKPFGFAIHGCVDG